MGQCDELEQFVGAKPSDHWSLATPWIMRQYVRGGALNGGQEGYILSNANWDAYPLLNDVEAFNLALANFAVTIPQRIERFPIVGRPPSLRA